MKKNLTAALLGLVLATSLPAQFQWEARKSISGISEGISADPLGRFYLVRNGMLIKYSGSGDSLASWSDPSKGAITRIDATDPLRTLVLQQDFNLLRFLSNRLSPLSDPIGLDQLGITDPLAIATCRQGGFWILDGTSLRLRRYDHQLTLVSETAPLNLPQTSGKNRPLLFESGSRLWLIIPGEEIRQFDAFGNPLYRLPMKVVSASPAGEEILLTYPDKLVLFSDPALPGKTLLEWPKSPLLEGCMQNHQLWIRTSGEVIILSR